MTDQVEPDLLPERDALALLTACMGTWGGPLEVDLVMKAMAPLTDDYDELKICRLLIAEVFVAARLVKTIGQIQGLPDTLILEIIGQTIEEERSS